MRAKIARMIDTNDPHTPRSENLSDEHRPGAALGRLLDGEPSDTAPMRPAGVRPRERHDFHIEICGLDLPGASATVEIADDVDYLDGSTDVVIRRVRVERFSDDGPVDLSEETLRREALCAGVGLADALRAQHDPDGKVVWKDPICPTLPAPLTLLGIDRDVEPATPHALQKVEDVLGFVLRIGNIDGAHHKAWVIDQIVRSLAGDRYEALVASVPGWQRGVAP